MPWSTRQLVELAGTTVNTVRHYHREGLLEEPERSVNGYKRYQVRHLLRLLRVKRLADLGLPLAEIAAMGGSDVLPSATLRQLDGELENTIGQLQRMRDELPPDALPETRQRLAEHLLPYLQQVNADHPWTLLAGSTGPLGAEAVRLVVAEAFTEIYNPAQLDVLRRIHSLLPEPPRKDT